MSARAWLLVLAACGMPDAALAQTSLTGSAEWSVAQTDNTTDTQTSSNSSFWQNYAIGFHSALIDPRLLKYDTEVTFRTNRLNAAGSNLADQHGRQNDLGFRVGAFALPSGAVPFFVQASRVFTGSTGELSFGNNVLGGLTPQTGAPINAFETEDRDLNLGGQLNVSGLPRAEVSYRRGHQIVTGGAERAEQRTADLSASVNRQTSRSQHALRYKRAGYDYVLSQTFTQRVDNLDYDFSAAAPGHLRLTARAGQRTTFSRSSLVAPPLQLSDQPYEPPPPVDGRSDMQYATAGIGFEPGARFSLRLNGTWDQQRAAAVATSATLGTGSLHAEVIRGVSINAQATAGHRGEVIGRGIVRDVATLNGIAGMTVSGGPRWLNGTVRASVGQGMNETPEGLRGETRSQLREANIASSVGWFGVGAGYEQVMSEDAILDYGNYFSERARGTIGVQSARFSLNGTADRLRIQRGHGITFTDHRQDTFAATLSMKLWRELMITGMGGGFRTTYVTAIANGVDQSLFWGGGAQTSLRGSFRAVAWVRSEDVSATSTHFAQQGLSALGRIEYRLRTLNFAVEYRHNFNELQYGGALVPTMFRGHQYRFSLTRQFGFAG